MKRSILSDFYLVSSLTSNCTVFIYLYMITVGLFEVWTI